MALSEFFPPLANGSGRGMFRRRDARRHKRLLPELAQTPERF
jgi:hypothetical protein